MRCASSTTSASREADLDRVGLPAREWALVGLNGNDVYSEPRGQLAGYEWPQYAVHRGRLHMLLYEKVVERIGAHAVKLGSRVTGYRKHDDGGVSALVDHADGSTSEARGTLLIGADGIHSAVRAQMHPRSRRSTGAAPSCGAAPRGPSPYVRARRSSASARIATGSSSTRSPIPTPAPASR